MPGNEAKRHMINHDIQLPTCDSFPQKQATFWGVEARFIGGKAMPWPESALSVKRTEF